VPLPTEEGDRRVPEVFQSPDVAEAVLRRDWVEKGLSHLTREDHEAIHAYFWEELRGAALAGALGLAEEHAKKPVKRAIKHLHQALTMLIDEPSRISI
jgi:DNA-directed RNA polymerase specialized sigma24 family protein